MNNKDVGDRGEDLAAAHLEARGWLILDRNYRYERAELDIVCYEPTEGGGTIVFVEVKTRRGLGYGRPEESVTPEKQRTIARVAEAYLYERELLNAPVRFDVVAVLLRDGSEPVIDHFEHAFDASAH